MLTLCLPINNDHIKMGSNVFWKRRSIGGKGAYQTSV